MSEAEHKTLSPKRSEPDALEDQQLSNQQLLLHQTTQSLLMASSMLCSGPVNPPTQIKFNVEDLLHENKVLQSKVKELSIERDRLLCLVANLRLELDMAELKRLPLELDEG